MRFENDGTGERDVTARIRIQSDAGVQTFGQLRLGYNSANEQLDVRYVHVRKPDGSVVSAGPDAITDMTAPVARDAPVYTDFKEKHVTVPDLAPGVTLEYETVTRLVTPLAPGEFWFDHNFVKSSIVLDEQLEISVPKGRKIDLQSSPQDALRNGFERRPHDLHLEAVESQAAFRRRSEKAAAAGCGSEDS